MFAAVMTSSAGATPFCDNGKDDKYREALSFFQDSERRLTKIFQKGFKLYQNSFVAYGFFVAVCLAVYSCMGGSLLEAGQAGLLGYAGAIAENFGLLFLRLKVNRQQSVAGISGMTLIMYAFAYSIREIVLFPPFDSVQSSLDEWVIKALHIFSTYIVFDVLWLTLVRYRSSYQEDLDVLKAKYLIPGCCFLAAVMHAQLREGPFYSALWTCCMYLDVVALMPQVVMMAKGAGKVEAPIAHFVAATALSKFVDLCYWWYAFDAIGPQSYSDSGFNFSAWLIVSCHVLHLLLVADFVYYQLRALCSGTGLQDLSIIDV